MAIDLGDLEKVGRFLQEVKNESWSSTINGDHLRDYFTTFSNYYYNKKQYPKANQSVIQKAEYEKKNIN